MRPLAASTRVSDSRCCTRSKPISTPLASVPRTSSAVICTGPTLRTRSSTKRSPGSVVAAQYSSAVGISTTMPSNASSILRRLLIAWA
jgi:hypothetical protein